MKSFTFLYIILGFISSQFANALDVATESLELVNVLYRHGDRSPINFYENDPFRNEHHKYWPDGLGQLTKKGKYMEYELGSWLRKRYKNLVSSRFVTEEIYVLSTDVDRTLMSAECVLASFYYPDNRTKFDNLILWTPTPVHTSPAHADKTLNVDQTCPRIVSAEIRANETREVREFCDKNKELLEYVSKHSGSNVRSLREAQYLFDTLKIEKAYGLKLPQWAEKIYEKLQNISDFCFKLSTLTKELKRLRAGPLLSEMVDHMVKKSMGKIPQRKLFMYSAHDATVATLLNALGVFDGIAPPYASTVLVELHRVDDKYFVNMLYQNDSSLVKDPVELILPGCTKLCPLNDWIALLEDVTPTDWDAECNRTGFSQEYVFMFAGWCHALAVVLALVLLGLVAYSYGLFCFVPRKDGLRLWLVKPANLSDNGFVFLN